MAPIFTRRAPTWRAAPGPDYDLREYAAGRPTERVATIRTLGERVGQIPGRHVVLVEERRRLIVVESHQSGGAVLRLPFRSCVDAVVHNDPGQPRFRFELVVALGGSHLTMSLWFDAAERPKLDRLAARIRRPAPPAAGMVPPLAVRTAPDNDDWLVFRPGPCSAAVLRAVTG